MNFFSYKDSLIRRHLFQTHQIVRIPIVNDMEFEKDENFEIELFDPEGGAKIGKLSRTAVTITNDDGEHNQILDSHKFNLHLW